MDELATLSVETLQTRVEAILEKVGLNAVQAASVARVIVAGERDACKSHGVYRIEGILRTVKAGKVRVDAEPRLLTGEGEGVVRVDAAGGFANPAFDLALPELAARAQRLGLAAMVITECTHFSALWSEVESVTAEGLACMAMCPSYATVAPAGGRAALLGTNPFAFGWPRRGRNPYVFDFATSVAARGEIELYRRAGKALPEGWAIDRSGAPTTDPAAALDGAMLPFGGHKGSAIATMIELLAAIMIGDLTSQDALSYLGTTSLSPKHGELIIAMSPERFAAGRTGDPHDRAEALFEAILGQGARLPSQRRFSARDQALREGIRLSAEEMAQLDRLQKLGLSGIG